MRIAVDVMGGDHGCGVVIEGVKRALAKRRKNHRRLSGWPAGGNPGGARHGASLTDPRVQVIHASEVMTMDDKPTAALRKKKDSSMARAIEMVATAGRTQLFLSETPAASWRWQR